MLSTKPPKYTRRAINIPPKHRSYKQVKLTPPDHPFPRTWNRRHDMTLLAEEKRFLMMMTFFTTTIIMCTTLSILIDKNAITGTPENPSICMLSNVRDCRTIYSSNAVSRVIEVSVRVDLLITIVLFVSSVILKSFKIFNSQCLIAFLVTGVVKALFISIALILILVDNAYYFNAVHSVLTQTCGPEFCMEDETANIVVAFVLLFFSAIVTFFMAVNVLFLGGFIVRRYDEIHTEQFLGNKMTNDFYH
ncbi:hypothetical protein B9Z55_024760 [Caenorhabditis nigoni]|nr:hypothetical protein B9Z55_024760 [Caenorhabditis nigoni]